MRSFLLGIATAVVLGVLVDMLTGTITTFLRTLRFRWADQTALDFDVAADGLFALGEWSPARTLSPRDLDTVSLSSEDRPVQVYIESATLATVVAGRTADTGQLAYITSFKINHNESAETQRCRVTLSGSDYAEVRAIEEIRQGPASGLLATADAAVESNVTDYVTHAIASSVAINVVPVTDDGFILAAKRSAAVDNGIGLWTLGIFETMKRSALDHPGEPEDFYRLGYRALREELGLDRDDYGRLNITWVGIYRPLLRGHVVAVTRLRTSRAEAVERARESDSSYEHAGFEWIKLDRTTVKAMLAADLSTRESGAAIDALGKTWIEQARLAAREAWRYRVLMNDET